MNTDTQIKPWVRLCTGALAAAGLAASMLGLASGTAEAAPAPVPTYHWCPGDPWDNSWGPYQNWNSCHDWEGNNFGGPAGYGAPPPWARPMPPPPPWAPWAHVVWNPAVNDWGYWDGPNWRGL